MSARERILSRVRAATTARGPVEAPEPLAPPLLAATLGAHRMSQFMAKLEAVDATVSRVSTVKELPKALAHELRNRNLPAAVRHGSDPVFSGLDWGTIDATRGIGRVEEPATISRAEFGMAETGTLVLASGPDNPVTLTFLGETHFVVLHERDVMGGFEDMWAAFRKSRLDPRTVNMVTGPSRSADIGQKLQLGAHGPVALHVFVVAD